MTAQILSCFNWEKKHEVAFSIQQPMIFQAAPIFLDISIAGGHCHSLGTLGFQPLNQAFAAHPDGLENCNQHLHCAHGGSLRAVTLS